MSVCLWQLPMHMSVVIVCVYLFVCVAHASVCSVGCTLPMLVLVSVMYTHVSLSVNFVLLGRGVGGGGVVVWGAKSEIRRLLGGGCTRCNV